MQDTQAGISMQAAKQPRSPPVMLQAQLIQDLDTCAADVDIANTCLIVFEYALQCADQSMQQQGSVQSGRQAVQSVPAAGDAGFVSYSYPLFALPKHRWPAPFPQIFVSVVPCTIASALELLPGIVTTAS